MKQSVILAILSLSLAIPIYGETRTWTEKESGRKISADFVSQTKDSVVLRLSANGIEVTVSKDRLYADDLEFLAQLASAEPAKFFPINPSAQATSPWYYVASAGGLFNPPVSSQGTWVRDRGRSSETPPRVSFPIIVETGVQRFVDPSVEEANHRVRCGRLFPAPAGLRSCLFRKTPRPRKRSAHGGARLLPTRTRPHLSGCRG
ncbi:MAG: SHD1 domain-containing protein [Verrucomicrobiota bacterium]